ncbi:hypothetical protein E4U19_000331 [Claviceps sp. Clav32 group G5]|nr:hypothetical protein E4U19_000331 [Claviceps sp. Clav32 group G5]
MPPYDPSPPHASVPHCNANCYIHTMEWLCHVIISQYPGFLHVPYDPAKRPTVAIPSYINQPATIEDLIEHVYPHDRLQRASQDHSTLDGRCLLATLNATVTEVNKLLLRSGAEGPTSCSRLQIASPSTDYQTE